MLNGQLYGNLSENDSISTELFSIGPYPINHLYLKCLESESSSSDCNFINSVWRNDAKNAANRAIQNGLKPTQDPVRKFTSGWLYDTTIDAYIRILTTKYKTLFAIDCVLTGSLMHPILPIRISRNRHNKVQKEAKYFVMPYNATGSHWSLLFVDLEKGSLIHFDSIFKRQGGPNGKLFENIKETLMAQYAVQLTGNTVINMQCAQQRDGKSCGIFAIHFVECLALGTSFLAPFNESNIEIMRAKIFKELIEHEGNRL